MRQIRFNQLMDIAKITTAVSDVNVSDGSLELLLDICINKVYQKFELLIKDDIHIPVTEQVTYKLPEDCIRVVSFKDQHGNELNVNTEDAYIRYNANLTVDLLYTKEQDIQVYITYIATPPPMSCESEDIVFSIQYLEPFMTYLNFLVHRMVGFKDLEQLRIYKQEWTESIADIQAQGLDKTPFRSNHDIVFTERRFV